MDPPTPFQAKSAAWRVGGPDFRGHPYPPGRARGTPTPLGGYGLRKYGGRHTFRAQAPMVSETLAGRAEEYGSTEMRPTCEARQRSLGK